MKLTEIRDAVTKDLSDYVGDYVFYLYQHGSLRFKIKGYKQYKGTLHDKFYDELDKSLGTMALNHLKYGACIDGFGFRIVFLADYYCSKKADVQHIDREHNMCEIRVTAPCGDDICRYKASVPCAEVDALVKKSKGE